MNDEENNKQYISYLSCLLIPYYLMKLPRFIIGITIIFWGWQTGLWFVAFPMALIYEASYFVRSRWE